MAKGDHIRVSRSFAIGYWHHGIDCGQGDVIHYSGDPTNKTNASIERTTMDRFLSGGKLDVVHHENSLSADDIVRLAESKLGEHQYSLVFNNCEHFANWCATGHSSSTQVQRLPLTVVAWKTLEAALQTLGPIPTPVRVLLKLKSIKSIWRRIS